MARVYVALDASLGRRVVVKILPLELSGGVSTERFRREIQLLARLQHPNIVPVLTAGAMDDLPFFTMPFVQGESLRVKLTRDGKLSSSEALGILKDVAAALAHAHAEGIVHRDIKPDNVLLSGRAAMVTDFGVSKAVRDAAGGNAAELTSVGVIVGTPAYMAPEQAAADPNVDHRADIYSFGAMAYELLTGQTPFANRTPQSMMAAHIHERPAHVVQGVRGIPPALGDVIMACLEKSPDARPQTADELLQRLERVGAEKSPARAWLLRHRVSRLKLLTVASGAVAVLAFVLALPLTRANSPAPGGTADSVGPPTSPAPVAPSPTQPSRPTGAVSVPRASYPAAAAAPQERLFRIVSAYPVVGDTFTLTVATPTGRRTTDRERTLVVRIADTSVVRPLANGRYLALKPGLTYALLDGRDSASGRLVKDSTVIIARERPTAPRRPPSSDTTLPAELSQAISLYESFQVEQAIPILRRLVATEETMRREHAAVAYQYLAATMALLGRTDSARLLARASLARDPSLRLDPSVFSATEFLAFSDAAVDYTIVGIAPLQRWVFTPGNESYRMSIGSGKPAEVRVLLRRAGAASDAEIFRAPVEGQRAIEWNGQIDGQAALAGRYEILAVALGRYGPASDTARRAFELRRVAAGAGSPARIIIEPR